MIVPEGYTEQQTIDTIKEISRKLSYKYVFTPYTQEDIAQEAFMFGMGSLGGYDAARGTLSTFLYTAIGNELKNFKRKMYQRPEKPNIAKLNVIQPIALDVVDDERESGMWAWGQILEEQEMNEMIEIIDRELPVYFRADYLRMRQDVYVPKPQREAVIQSILQILEKYEYEI
jgi:DNA-directed RNA polymerase specialized sigma24 family protein